MQIFKDFTFDSAHFLPNVPEGHKCRQTHGHTYRLRVYLEGKPKPPYGWVMDFGDIKKVVEPLLNRVDHKMLNEVEGLQNPTCELLAVWLFHRIKSQIPELKRVELNETPTSGVIYEGESLA